ncbi:hypothetical protein B0T20DRAFT_424376 [Sordaria brevicollis]|uniref:Retrovirus-related Pol polyprotein from transposon TNT 1-94-like beta-barrel domain-containing protein n=1 Tax=Sordaria brevicollis TaxID=83679 RepID=A0AAE0U5D3_SORBR|nr:hypothetical protein B0T20DRAFT_424376 [Sordaria brevicollis]
MGHDISKPTGEPVSFNNSGVSVPAAFSPVFRIQNQNRKKPRNQKQKKMRSRRAQKDEGPLNLGARTHPSIPMLCPDWVWSTMSNVSVAKDREWFTTYTPFDSTVCISGQNLAVRGIGTVNLNVKRHPARAGRQNQGILPLRTVLHVPDATCNILAKIPNIDGQSCSVFIFPSRGESRSYSVMDGEEVEGHHASGPKTQNDLMKGCIKDHKGRMVAYFDPEHVLFALKLSGPPIGPITRESVLKASPESLPVSIFAQWASDELDKWSLKREMQNLLADRPVHGDDSDDDATSATLDTSDDEEADPDFVMGNGNSNVGPGPGPGGTRQNQQPREERYTKEEKQFLKRNWKSEWKFLQLYGLDVSDDKARDLGRDILRSMMQKDEAAKKSNTRMTGFAARATGRRPQARKVIKRSGPRAQKINTNGFLTATLGNYRVTRPPRVPQRRLGGSGSGSGRLAVIKEERV